MVRLSLCGQLLETFSRIFLRWKAACTTKVAVRQYIFVIFKREAGCNVIAVAGSCEPIILSNHKNFIGHCAKLPSGCFLLVQGSIESGDSSYLLCIPKCGFRIRNPPPERHRAETEYQPRHFFEGAVKLCQAHGIPRRERCV